MWALWTQQNTCWELGWKPKPKAPFHDDQKVLWATRIHLANYFPRVRLQKLAASHKRRFYFGKMRSSGNLTHVSTKCFSSITSIPFVTTAIIRHCHEISHANRWKWKAIISFMAFPQQHTSFVGVFIFVRTAASSWIALSGLSHCALAISRKFF